MVRIWCRFIGIDVFCLGDGQRRVFSAGPTASISGTSAQRHPRPDDHRGREVRLLRVRRAATKRFTMLRRRCSTPRRWSGRPGDGRRLSGERAHRRADGGRSGLDDAAIRYDWTTVTGIGYVAAARMQVALRDDPSVSDVAVDGRLTDVVAVDHGPAEVRALP